MTRDYGKLQHLVPALFVLVFGGLILAAVSVGAAATVWLLAATFKWAKRLGHVGSGPRRDGHGPDA